MKIVVLDGYGMNPGDLSWDGLKALGDLTVYDRTSSREDVITRASGADAVLTNKTILDAELLKELKGLKYVGVLATGYNVVDLATASELGIVVTNIPAYSTDSVAQMVFAHILAITNHVEYYTAQNRDGRWSHNADFCYWDSPIIELAGKTLGVVGFGNIGQAVSKIALAMGLKVNAFTSKSQVNLPNGVTKVGLDELFSSSDIISLHCPLTDSTKEIINASTLAKMKPSAILINTGRGPLVNEQDLADALNNGTIAAAGVDVLTVEPARVDNPLLSARNCYITPHVAWASLEARQRLNDIAVNNLKAFIAGSPINRVN